MSFHPDLKQGQFDAEKDSKLYTKDNYKTLLNIYYAEMTALLNAAGGLESNLGMYSRYWLVRNKFQYVQAKFTKE